MELHHTLCPGGMFFDVTVGSCNIGECPVEEIPIVDCPSTGVTLLPHPEVCSQYIICRGGHPVERSCSPNFHFNYENQACMTREVANCLVEHPTCAEIDDPQNPVYHPHPHFCDRYFICFQGNLWSFYCADGDYWDALHGWCVPAEEAHCEITF